MADKRIVYTIPANQWIRVVNGAKYAKIFRSNIDSTYYSMLFDSPADTPPDGVLPSTAEKIFLYRNSIFVKDISNVYVWISCAKDEIGEVKVTL